MQAKRYFTFVLIGFDFCECSLITSLVVDERRSNHSEETRGTDVPVATPPNPSFVSGAAIPDQAAENGVRPISTSVKASNLREALSNCNSYFILVMVASVA